MLNDDFFASDELYERTVMLPNGTEHVLHFKQVPAVEFRKFQLSEQSGDEKKQTESMARLIAASLCEPDGKPALTVEKALRLNTAATTALFAKVLEVNGFNQQGNG
ncbi:hypothetical protein MW7_007350 [Imbroritus primus]|uniref:Uncharacterized protein n=1 Tax=Imbroritus primus TaxID=3058603 RepID=A0ACD3SQF6_9BURK|nr:hypothetical protein MW7_007350 [Burkholderiaceae bacterium PBA]